MENKENEIRLKKIPLKIFLEALTDIYNRGVDFVDIIGSSGEEQDSIGIAIKEEYFSNNDILDEEEEDREIDFPKDLSDEDLNQLI
jgi:hypothetical protein